VTLLGEVHAKSVDLYLHQQGIDTTTPAGKALFQMMGVFAEFERAIIRERVNAGLARARAFGKRLGRQGDRQGIAPDIVAEIAHEFGGATIGRIVDRLIDDVSRAQAGAEFIERVRKS
jgi:DNA invertase Pin-like site-specific DNA recombinase